MIDRSKLENSFEFVVVAGARARQLMKGARPRITGPAKDITIAQHEVITRKVEKTQDGVLPTTSSIDTGDIDA